MQEFHHSILVQKTWSANVAAAEISRINNNAKAETQRAQSTPLRSQRVGSKTLRLAAADKRNVLVIHFARELAWTRLGCGELHFADQSAAPGFVHLRAEFRLHLFELLLPRIVIGGDFQAPRLATDRTRVGGESFADDAGPNAGKPCHDRFRPFDLTQHTAKKISRSFHYTPRAA